MNRTQFLNLIKQYWKSHSELSFESIIKLFIYETQDGYFVMNEDEAKAKILELNQNDEEIDNFIRGIF